MISQTPLTDALAVSLNTADDALKIGSLAGHARNLERLLAEAVGALEFLKEMCESATPWKYSEEGIREPIDKALARIKAAKEQPR